MRLRSWLFGASLLYVLLAGVLLVLGTLSFVGMLVVAAVLAVSWSSLGAAVLFLALALGYLVYDSQRERG